MSGQFVCTKQLLVLENGIPVRHSCDVIGHYPGPPGLAQLYVDGKLVGQAEFPYTTPLSLGLTGGIAVGADPGAPVAPFYQTPFKFTGTLFSVNFDVSGDVIKDEEAEMRMIMARQ